MNRLSAPIHELGLPAKMVKALSADGITTIGRLIGLTREDLLRTPGIGRKAIGLVVGVVEARGLTLRDEAIVDARQKLVRTKVAAVLSNYLAPPLAQNAAEEIGEAIRSFLGRSDKPKPP